MPLQDQPPRRRAMRWSWSAMTIGTLLSAASVLVLLTEAKSAAAPAIEPVPTPAATETADGPATVPVDIGSTVERSAEPVAFEFERPIEARLEVREDETGVLVFDHRSWLASGAEIADDDASVRLEVTDRLSVDLEPSEARPGVPIHLTSDAIRQLETTAYTARLKTPRFDLPVAVTADPAAQIVWRLRAYPYEVDDGRLIVPVRVLARERVDGRLNATVAPTTTRFLLEAPGSLVEPPEVTIAIGEPRSPQAHVVLPPGADLEVTASPLDGRGEPTRETLRWREHGPQRLELEVAPSPVVGWASPTASWPLHIRLLLDGKPTAWPTALSVEAPPGLSFEPIDLRLEGDASAKLELRADGAIDDALRLKLPDLGVEREVAVQLDSPWLLLCVAALFGLVGVGVARRHRLLEQPRIALAFEILAAVSGGALLYFLFLVGWIPGPSDLFDEMPAGALGVLGGYLGEGVFQIFARRFGVGADQRPADEPDAEAEDAEMLDPERTSTVPAPSMTAEGETDPPATAATEDDDA